jgi:hypothetical protein
MDAQSMDTISTLAYAMDLTPLVMDPDRDIIDYFLGAIHRFETDVRRNLQFKLGSASPAL